MSGFNFGMTGESAVRTSRRMFAPWGIYDVVFKNIEVKEFQGKKDPSATYKCISITFEDSDFYFPVNIWFPKDGDDERRSYNGANGGTVEMPSNFEVTMNMVKQTAQVLNPSGFEKMQAASSKFKSFDDVANALVKILTPVKGKQTKIKLIGRNRDGKVQADVPRIVAINKEGELYICDNYIGDKLYFTDYEEGKKNEYKSASPTKMSDPVVTDIDTNTSGFELDDLL